LLTLQPRDDRHAGRADRRKQPPIKPTNRASTKPFPMSRGLSWKLNTTWVKLADELLLGGQRAVPQKALASGFVFRHRTLDGALAAILGAGATPKLHVPRSSRPHIAHGID
jgi:uncharacterized protein DUF1731